MINKHGLEEAVEIWRFSEKNLKYHPSYFVKEITDAFFSYHLSDRTNPKTSKEEYYCINKEILFAFYKLKLLDTSVYFLNTAYKQ